MQYLKTGQQKARAIHALASTEPPMGKHFHGLSGRIAKDETRQRLHLRSCGQIQQDDMSHSLKKDCNGRGCCKNLLRACMETLWTPFVHRVRSGQSLPGEVLADVMGDDGHQVEQKYSISPTD